MNIVQGLIYNQHVLMTVDAFNELNEICYMLGVVLDSAPTEIEWGVPDYYLKVWISEGLETLSDGLLDIELDVDDDHFIPRQHGDGYEVC